MRNFIRKILMLCITLFIVFTLSCTNNLSLKRPKLTIKLTDFPLGAQEVVGVRLGILSIDALTEHGGWESIIDFGVFGKEFELLELANGKTATLGSFELPPGEYKKLRMTIRSENIIVIDDGISVREELLILSSKSHANIKVLNEFELEEDHISSVTIDFDAQKSISFDGSNYYLTPFVRVSEMTSTQAVFSLSPIGIAGQSIQPSTPPNATVSKTLLPEGITGLATVSFGDNVTMDGNVFVLSECGLTVDSLCLAGNFELTTGVNFSQSASSVMKANRVNIGANSSLLGTLEANNMTFDATVNVANTVSPLGNLPALLDYMKGHEGEQNLHGDDSPLTAGVYKNLNVAGGRTMQLSGGSYHFEKIILADNSHLLCLKTCQIFIRKKMVIGNNVIIDSSLNNANALYVFIGRNRLGDDVDDVTYNSFITGTNSVIQGNFYIPYGAFNLGEFANFSGSVIAKTVTIGSGSMLKAVTPSIIVSEEFIAQGNYNGEAFQVDFIDSNNLKMLTSRDPFHVFYGKYSHNLATRTVTISYHTVDLIDPDCLTCRLDGIYPSLATYSADSFYIPAAYWGMEIVSISNAGINARVLSDDTPVTFNRRIGFGPYDE